MRYDDFVGQGALAAHLKEAIESGRFVHAYLFSGPYGTGKRSMAGVCARALHCHGQDKPCDVCPACRRSLAGTHPDTHLLAPEKSIGVDAVRGLLEVLALRPFEEGRQVAIIHQADRMTVQAQNALLKTLEAPSGNVVFFLVTDAPHALLSTVRSRVAQVRFGEITNDLVERALVLRGMQPQRARVLALMSQGSVGRALDLDKDEQFSALRDAVLAALERMECAADMPPALVPLRDKENARAILDILENAAREGMRAQAGQPAALPGKALARVLQMRPVRLAGEVLAARQKLERNVSWPMVADMLFLNLLEGNGCQQ